jgi:hypothetical protein
MLGKMVYTPHGKGVAIAEFRDGTYCVEYEHGGGAVLPHWEIFCSEAGKELSIPVKPAKMPATSRFPMHGISALQVA